MKRNRAAFQHESLPLQPASEGFGPLLQRDYWAVIAGCRSKPSEVMEQVVKRFWEFAPTNLCRFERRDLAAKPLEVGDELEIDIRFSAHCQVRVLHRDSQSLTLGTLQGHPEAGRITFAAYRNPKGDVIFHIRSRARSSSGAMFAGFVAVGEAMQTNTWTDFVNRVALTTGDGVLSVIHAETKSMPEGEDSDPMGPTFVARGE